MTKKNEDWAVDAQKHMQKEMKRELKAQVEPLVAMLFRESISSKVVVSGPSLEQRPESMTPGPYWVVYCCIEHMTGVKTIPLTLGRFWPTLTEELAAQLQAMGNLMIIKERDRFSEDELSMIYGVFVDLIKESFGESEVFDNPGSYFDACCKMFPGDVTKKMRQDYVRFQSKLASQQQVAGAEG